MAALVENSRQSIRNNFMERISEANESCSLTKPQLRAAVNAIDDWVEANAAAFNSAIPQPARGALTSLQKNLLLQLVLTLKAQGL